MRNLLPIAIGLTIIFGCADPAPEGRDDTVNKSFTTAQFSSDNILQHLVPIPKEMTIYDDFFELSEDVRIVCDEASEDEAEGFQRWFEEELGWDMEIELHSSGSKSQGTIRVLSLVMDTILPGGGLNNINIEPTHISIQTFNGSVHEAFNRIKQLIPVEALKGEVKKAKIPCVQIIDHSDFKHRGVLLDCCRHFFTVEEVKEFIEAMSHYQFNVLHWHLTEDQGWRIESKKYPKLNEIGSWRTELDGSRYGGYYTHGDIKEIVQYAMDRGVEIIPEIEMPGHSQAAIASYPYLGCTGEQVEVANDWGVFKEVYCAGKEETYTFLTDVLTEIMPLFPSNKVHIGGDEAPTTRWESCEECKALMEKEGMTDVHELQGYFLRRIHKFLAENGKIMIGWDEILEADLPEDVMIQIWRDAQYGIDAASAGRKIILSPTSHCYFDYPLSATDTEEVIEYQPFARYDDEAKRNVLGIECNLWSEHIPTREVLHQQAYPRMFAMADVMWNGGSVRKYDSMNAFKSACEFHSQRLRELGLTPGWAQEPIQWSVRDSKNTKNKEIVVDSPEGDIELNAQWKDQEGESPVITGSELSIPLTRSGHLEITATSPAYGEFQEVISLATHKAWDATTEYQNEYSEWYTAGGNLGLVDGVRASLDFRDGHWQGFWGDNCMVTVELESAQEITSIQSQFYQYVNAWIIIPPEVKVEVSIDGESWKTFGEWKSPLEPTLRGKYIQEMKLESEPALVRFIRLSATNFGVLPDWHEAAGSEAWIFIDEIEVR